METIRFKVNGQPVELQIDASTPLLWAIREHLGLTGTKFGCGMALCGACTVHVITFRLIQSTYLEGLSRFRLEDLPERDKPSH